MQYGIVYTLVFVKKNAQLLLGLKKRGLGEGKWNGFGGKVDKNETILDGAIRETKEECNLQIKNLNHIGVIAYEERITSKVDLVHVFTTSKYLNVPEESEEMKPQWFDIQNLPFQQMWPDGKFWFPYMLKEKHFFAHVIYDEKEEFKNCTVKECSSLNSVLELVRTIT